MTPDELAQIIRTGQEAFRRELASESKDSAKRLQDAYKNVLGDLNMAIADFQDAAQRRKMTTGGLADDAATRRLQAQVQEALDGLNREIAQQADIMQQAGILSGLKTGIAALEATVDSTFARPSTQEIDALINYVDSPAFQDALDHYGAYHAGRISDIILSNVSLGKGPASTAYQIVNYLNNFPLADAMNMTRTVQLWSARSAQHEIYRANDDIVMGWIWSSAQDARTCLSCIAMDDGSIHSLDETLNDHHMGRCAPIPATAAWADLGAISNGSSSVDADIQTGQDWFDSLTTNQQRQIMGPARWAAWRDGAFDFSDLSVEYHNLIYGAMRREASLNELIGPELADKYKRKVA